jgi:hypothetical protein
LGENGTLTMERGNAEGEGGSGWREKREEREKKDLYGLKFSRVTPGGYVVKGGRAAGRGRRTGTTHVDVVPRRHLGTRQPYATCQCKWHDSFMCRANRTDTTEK